MRSTRCGQHSEVYAVWLHGAICTVPSTQLHRRSQCQAAALRPHSTARPHRALRAVRSTPHPPPLPTPPGFGVSLKRSHSLFLPGVRHCEILIWLGDWRKLDGFPASHESGVHSLVLLFKVNSWNITCLLIMQKHLHGHMVSFGITSVDPQGSLSSEQESGRERQAAVRLGGASGSRGAWTLNNGGN